MSPKISISRQAKTGLKAGRQAAQEESIDVFQKLVFHAKAKNSQSLSAGGRTQGSVSREYAKSRPKAGRKGN